MLTEWAERLEKTKSGLDLSIFKDLMKNTIRKLKENGYQHTWEWLHENYTRGNRSNYAGVHLLSSNSKFIKDKLWSLKRKGKI